MKFDTQLVHCGRASGDETNAVNPPLVRASTVLFASLADLKHAYEGQVFESLRYGRSGTVTTFELQTAMATIEGAEGCIATASGLSAIAAVLSAHAGPGKHLFVYGGVYGPTRALCERELRALGCTVDFFDSAEELAERIGEQTSLVYIECPSSVTMEMLDVQAMCGIAHRIGARVACDSTWGTPVFFHPHALGIDISVHSATKYINGHSDVMLGLITGTHESLASTRTWCDRYGSHASPDSCWLALRGLRTLGVRMQRHQESALIVARWLREQPQVKRVLYPVLPDDPGHLLWKKQFSGGAGPFTFELGPCTETDFAGFIDALTLFGLGASWGGFESLVMPAIPHHRWALKVQPDEGRLVRLHIGLEDPADLCADLQQALAHLRSSGRPGQGSAGISNEQRINLISIHGENE
jgi:cysteine-S-conjugate beta-lyase